MDVGGPAGWQVMAQNVWDYYAAALPSDRAQLRPPFEAFHWIAVGDCPGDATQFVLPHVENCMAGNTTVWAGPSVSDIYIMDVGMKNGTLHHELLHAWLALSGVEGGDENHTRDEWKTLLPAAFNDVRQ